MNLRGDGFGRGLERKLDNLYDGKRLVSKKCDLMVDVV